MKELVGAAFDSLKHHMVESATLKLRDDELTNGGLVALMAGSTLGVWAVSGGIWYLSTKKKEETKPLNGDDEKIESAAGATGVSSLSIALSIPALFAH